MNILRSYKQASNILPCYSRSVYQDKIPAPTAQTTRNERACTAEGCIRTKFLPRRPKRPERPGVYVNIFTYTMPLLWRFRNCLQKPFPQRHASKLAKYHPATAEGCIRTKFPPRRPKRPETRGRAPQKGTSG